jgi:hypothetical protein
VEVRRQDRIRTAARMMTVDSSQATDLGRLRRRSARKLKRESAKNRWRSIASQHAHSGSEDEDEADFLLASRSSRSCWMDGPMAYSGGSLLGAGAVVSGMARSSSNIADSPGALGRVSSGGNQSEWGSIRCSDVDVQRLSLDEDGLQQDVGQLGGRRIDADDETARDGGASFVKSDLPPSLAAAIALAKRRHEAARARRYGAEVQEVRGWARLPSRACERVHSMQAETRWTPNQKSTTMESRPEPDSQTQPDGLPASGGAQVGLHSPCDWVAVPRVLHPPRPNTSYRVSAPARMLAMSACLVVSSSARAASLSARSVA